jgi:dTDP-4-amino-4,6-dideoxygalactose transaminase
VVNHVGAKIVLVDTAENSFQMDYDQLESAITPNTKVIIPVDIGGVMCDYDRIFEIIERKRSLFNPGNEIQEAFGRIIILADAAHSFGATYKDKKSGEVADFTSFSFHAVKNFTTGEGGAITWKNIHGINNKDIYEQFMLFSLHGQSKDALSKTKLGSWEYDIVYPGYKFNMTDIMASIGLGQLKRYPSNLERRKEIIRLYDDAFKGYDVDTLQHFGEDYSSSGHLYLVRLLGKDEMFRNKIIKKMAERNIATNVHYKPLPMHTAYKKLGFDINQYPNAYNMYKNEISLPLHTLLTEQEIQYIVENLQYFIKDLTLSKLEV